MPSMLARLAAFIEGLGFTVCILAAITVAASVSPQVGILVGCAGAGGVGLVGATLRALAGQSGSARHPRAHGPPGLPTERVRPLRPRPEEVRGVTFTGPADTSASTPPPPLAIDSVHQQLPESAILMGHAERAIGNLDLLTHTKLHSGAQVFICMGDEGRCGAAFPADLREDLQQHFEDRCPACSEIGNFRATNLPAAPPPPPPTTESVPPSLPTEPGAEAMQQDASTTSP